MTKRFRLIPIVTVVVLAAAATWLLVQQRPAKEPSPAPPTPRPLVIVPAGYAPTTGSPLAIQLNAATNSAREDLEALDGLVAQFTTTFKRPQAPPMGDNQDVVAALTGGNRQRIVFLPPDHPAIDAEGRLLDRWGTPYFFHARAAGVFELRSAGPDGEMFTLDDVTDE